MMSADDQEIDLLLNEESDTFFESLRDRKLHELKKNTKSTKFNQNDGELWGYLTEISHEKELLHMTTASPRLIIHFHNPAFASCTILNDHLTKLARKYPKTRFVYIEATNAPFMIVKMKIQVLPCLVCVVDTLAVDRIVGFDDLGGTEHFTTKELEDRLAKGSRIFQVPRRWKSSEDRMDQQSDSE